MSWKYTLLQAASLVGAYGSSLIHPHHARSERISWGPCDFGDDTLQCGNLSVPLDYTDPHSNATLKLQLLKVPAVHTPKKGSILFNFGGPGLESRMSLAAYSARYLASTGGEYDLIAHDPRGTAQTFTASCYNSTEKREADLLHIGNIADPEDIPGIGKLWAGSQVLADACYNYPGFQEKGSLVGTAFSARDLMQIVDAVEPDGLLRYWGISYGTALGATVAALFPDRIERIVLDAVMNLHQFFNGYDTEVYADSDTVVHNFIKECLDLPELCGFSHRNSTADEIENDLFNLLSDLRREPIVHGSTIIDPTLVRSFIRYTLYNPISYSNLSIALDALLPPVNTALFMEIHDVHMGSNIDSLAADESPFAIHCGDKPASQPTLDKMKEVFEELNSESRFIGSSGIGLQALCANWKITAKERYEGNFDVRTKHPMLVVGNTFDSATPFRSAQNLSAIFEDSVLVEHGGFGHGSTVHGSECTARIIRDYFADGTLPAPDTFCEVSYHPFEAKTLDDVLEEAGFYEDLIQ
ncbi:TAP-like protein-domain-containing protein [Aspergillus karnatakaensis]|uniref:alpha/beta hydrolase n=1 Tax=Aspergillus karnatakaensis TaxID=1810916 RepID=UPI003CCE0F83